MHRAASAIFAFAALGILLLIGFWPAWFERLLQSRLVAELLAAWCVGTALLLHPEVSAGLVRGIREFRKAVREVFFDDKDWFF